MAEYISIPAKVISYSGTRPLSAVKGIVFHNTGNDNDKAVSNGNYFKTSNVRRAGAHIFIDQEGTVVMSISFEKNANAVGGAVYTGTNPQYYGVLYNANTISIELCDIVHKEPSDKMMAACAEVVKDIRSKCPNAKTMCFHRDINGKPCPAAASDAGWRDRFWSRLNEKLNPTPAKPAVKLDKAKYTKGLKYILKDDAKIYSEPSATKETEVPYKKFTDAGKKKDKNKDGKFDKGSTILVSDVVVKENGNQFVKVGSGYIKAFTKSTKTNILRKKPGQ